MGPGRLIHLRDLLHASRRFARAEAWSECLESAQRFLRTASSAEQHHHSWSSDHHGPTPVHPWLAHEARLLAAMSRTAIASTTVAARIAANFADVTQKAVVDARSSASIFDAESSTPSGTTGASTRTSSAIPDADLLRPLLAAQPEVCRWLLPEDTLIDLERTNHLLDTNEEHRQHSTYTSLVRFFDEQSLHRALVTALAWRCRDTLARAVCPPKSQSCSAADPDAQAQLLWQLVISDATKALMLDIAAAATTAGSTTSSLSSSSASPSTATAASSFDWLCLSMRATAFAAIGESEFATRDILLREVLRRKNYFAPAGGKRENNEADPMAENFGGACDHHGLPPQLSELRPKNMLTARARYDYRASQKRPSQRQLRAEVASRRVALLGGGAQGPLSGRSKGFGVP